MSFKKSVKNLIWELKKEKIIPIFKEQPDLIFEGKIAFVCGATGGIGYAISKMLIENGCKVILTGRNEDKLINLKKEFGEKCCYVVMDLKDSSQYASCVAQSVSKFGRIDFFIHSAGIHTSFNGFGFFDVTEKDYDDIMKVNLKSAFFLSKQLSEYFIKNRIKGRILLISSQRALEPAWSPYRLSKKGLCGLVEGLAEVLTPYGIVVNGIGPGPTNTDMINYVESDGIYAKDSPIHRYTTTVEISNVAKMLLSSSGDTIIGQTIFMSGGMGIID